MGNAVMYNRELIQFNFFISQYIHSSWLERISHGDIILKLRHQKNTESYFSDYLLDHFKLKNNYCFDVSSEYNNFILMDSEKLLDIVRFMGVFVNVQKIQHLIDGKFLNQVKSVVGRDAYKFAMHRAPFLSASGISIKLQCLDNKLLGEHIMRCGACCLMKALSELPVELKKRIFLKLPVKISTYLTDYNNYFLGDNYFDLLIKIFNEIEN